MSPWCWRMESPGRDKNSWRTLGRLVSLYFQNNISAFSEDNIYNYMTETKTKTALQQNTSYERQAYKWTCFVHLLAQIVRIYPFDQETKHVTLHMHAVCKNCCAGVTIVGCKESEHLSHAAQTQANNRNIQITLSPFSPGSPGFPGTPCNKHQHIRVKRFTSCEALLWWSGEMSPWCERSHSLYYIML